jgi:hypothetical protein
MTLFGYGMQALQCLIPSLSLVLWQIFSYLREQGYDIPTAKSLQQSDDIVSTCQHEVAMRVSEHVRDSIEYVFQLDKTSDSDHNIHFADTIVGSGCIFTCWSNALQKLDDSYPQSPLDLRMAVVNRIKQTQDPVLLIWYLNQHAQRRYKEAYGKSFRSRSASDRFPRCYSSST